MVNSLAVFDVVVVEALEAVARVQVLCRVESAAVTDDANDLILLYNNYCVNSELMLNRTRTTVRVSSGQWVQHLIKI